MGLSSLEDIAKDKDLEPFFSIEVAAELCGCTIGALDVFIRRYMTHFKPHYYHLGEVKGHPLRVMYRSEIIEIRNRLLENHVSRTERQLSRKGYTGQIRKINRWEVPSRAFLLSK